MARKKLIKGSNAERVEKRIANTPEDVNDKISVFSVLKEVEENKLKLYPADEKTKLPEPEQLPEKVIKKKKASKKTKEFEKKTNKNNRKAKKDLPAEEKTLFEENDDKELRSSVKKSSKSTFRFNKNEKDIIVKSCKAYKNTLPIYLRYVQEEVKTIDEIIRKLK